MTSHERHDPRSVGSLWRASRKYLAFVRLGFAGARAEPAELYARVLFLLIILGVFASLWRAVATTGANVGGDANTFVWYLAMTEWVLMSAPHIHFRIEDDVRRGDVAYQIVRPASYLGAHFAEGVGALGARAPVMLTGACVGAWMFGGAPRHPAAIGRAVLFGCAAALVITGYNVVLGLAAFWLGDIAPVYWIWQKLTFVLGGLLLPLTLYPQLVISIARLTPFSAVLAGPASFVLDRSFFSAGTLAVALTGWAVVAAIIAALTFRSIARRLQLNGG
jgi:ABC-2 type transport system permease protein